MDGIIIEMVIMKVVLQPYRADVVSMKFHSKTIIAHFTTLVTTVTGGVQLSTLIFHGAGLWAIMVFIKVNTIRK